MRHQKGMTLLEVLIALAIFSLIGVASYRVLFSVINVQNISEQHSSQLSLQQKVVAVLDRDFSQLIDREVRISVEAKEPSLWIGGDYIVALTRGGLSNPLGFQRSNLQRIAYDIGPHPDSADRNSQHYQDEQLYLRRHSWPQLDRNEQPPRTRAILANTVSLEVLALTKQGAYTRWPVNDLELEDLLAIELSIDVEGHGPIKRLYKVN